MEIHCTILWLSEIILKLKSSLGRKTNDKSHLFAIQTNDININNDIFI